MRSRFDDTRAALEHFDAVDKPAFEALCRNGAHPVDFPGFVAARKRAADRVRGAFLADAGELAAPEYVDVMSVDDIRRVVGGNLLGKLLRLLP